MIALALFATAALSAITLIAVVNVLTFPRLDASNPLPEPPPFLSVLIPARDEAAVIGATVRRLLAQDTLAFEVIVLDDGSTDRTARAALDAANGDSRFRIVQGQPLPPGWAGKPWACQQLAEQAAGDVLIFTDAEVRWEAGGLRAAAAEMARTHADLLSVWPTQITRTPAERLTVPLMALVVLGYLPYTGVAYIPWPVFAAANGQCMIFRRSAYRQIGGHAAVRGEVLEDVLLARAVKRAGLRLRLADGAGRVACRMYDSYPAVRDGYAKNILAGYGGSLAALMVATVFHWLVFVGPWLWLAAGWALTVPGWPWWPLALIALGVGVRALTAAFTRQRAADALLMPVSVLLMTAIAARSAWWHLNGGPQWKGRTITRGASNG